jgi:hypothetical protein
MATILSKMAAKLTELAQEYWYRAKRSIDRVQFVTESARQHRYRIMTELMKELVQPCWLNEIVFLPIKWNVRHWIADETAVESDTISRKGCSNEIIKWLNNCIAIEQYAMADRIRILHIRHGSSMAKYPGKILLFGQIAKVCRS